ncbi:hypothetical protein CHELA40_11844 [Chelatococcus asaccharovorans]|nr:hypothetical protein CHELA40_11844 [Chelatococcus asaccharovorans]CAH1683951.1 hypothetical protein CHELA17_63756 [Chelatococcus asaccharovorans]
MQALSQPADANRPQPNNPPAPPIRQRTHPQGMQCAFGRAAEAHSALALSYPHWGGFGKDLFADLSTSPRIYPTGRAQTSRSRPPAERGPLLPRQARSLNTLPSKGAS